MSLEYTLLGLLNRKARTGYELSKIVSKTTNFYWTATRTQVYQSLKRMAEKGWIGVETIPQTGKPSKQLYHILDKGKDAFNEWLLQPPGSPIMKEPFLLHMYFLDSLEKEDIIKKIQDMRNVHVEHLEEFKEFEKNIVDPRRSDKENMARYLPLNFGIEFETALIHWCDEAQKRVEALEE